MPWQANNNQAGEFRAPSQQIYKTNTSEVNKVVFSLKVRKIMPNDQQFKDLDGYCSCAYMNVNKSFKNQDFQEYKKILEKNGNVYVHVRQNAQFVSLLRHDDKIPQGTIYLPEIQMINNEICDGEIENWSFYINQEYPASSCTINVRPLIYSNEKIIAKAGAIANAFSKHCFQRIITENERYFMKSEDILYLIQVTEIDIEEDEEDEFTLPDVYRGKIDEDTVIYVQMDKASDSTLFEIQDIISKKNTDTSSNIINIITNDDEIFPVKKKLLYPCISLTSAVMSGHGVHKDTTSTIHVNIDCCTFDRVLLYLEHEARNKGESFRFDPSHLDSLLEASKQIGCIGLQDVCHHLLGEFDSRVREFAIPWEEVIEHNSKGDVWLVMDGMIFDVTRWLSEHPGGSTIIPRDALNIDCTVMFEIYHSSRQSFRYLKQFYIGELSKEDRKKVLPSKEIPSDAFIEELRQYTKWRIQPKEKVHKSF